MGLKMFTALINNFWSGSLEVYKIWTCKRSWEFIMDRDSQAIFHRKVLLFLITIVLAWVIAEMRRYRRQKEEETPGKNSPGFRKADRPRVETIYKVWSLSSSFPFPSFKVFVQWFFGSFHIWILACLWPAKAAGRFVIISKCSPSCIYEVT